MDNFKGLSVKIGFSSYDEALMEAPSYTPGRCVVCGRTPVQAHHLVPRSHGGSKGPVVHLCGLGNASGCHGKAHSHRLHFRYAGKLEYLLTDEPVKDYVAYDMEGWKDIGF